MNRAIAFVALSSLAVACLVSEASALSLTTVQVESNIPAPVLVTFAPDDSTRLFVVGQGGKIFIIKNDSLYATPFLDISSKVLFSGEQGLLGLAFHPAYATNGYFFVYYTADPDGHTVVARFQVSASPDFADASSESPLLAVAQPYQNHNGGMMAFGPDGYLYIGLGDGGSGGDPENRAQNPDSLLGKLLRIDVGTGPEGGYTIPPTNPFFGLSSPRPEIWAFGLRNPWRWSFDRLTGDLIIADVGQNQWEEIDFESSSGPGGANYGWRLKEADHCYNPPSGCDTLIGLTDPIWEYSHDSSRCAVTGGYIYRGCAIPELQGKYLFGDYCTGEIWALTQTSGTISSVVNLASQIGQDPFQLSAFGEDYFGELYICNLGFGIIWKIVPIGPPATCIDCCQGIVGNVDNSPDQSVDVSDLTALIAYLFLGSTSLCYTEANADLSLDGNVDIGDVTRLIDFLFLTFAPLGNCL